MGFYAAPSPAERPRRIGPKSDDGVIVKRPLRQHPKPDGRYDHVNRQGKVVRRYPPPGQHFIDEMRPAKIKGDQELVLRNLAVFLDDDGDVIISLISRRGTVSVPLSKKTAARLAYRLTQTCLGLGPAA